MPAWIACPVASDIELPQWMNWCFSGEWTNMLIRLFHRQL